LPDALEHYNGNIKHWEHKKLRNVGFKSDSRLSWIHASAFSDGPSLSSIFVPSRLIPLDRDYPEGLRFDVPGDDVAFNPDAESSAGRRDDAESQ
jgi:hypothetical protein